MQVNIHLTELADTETESYVPEPVTMKFRLDHGVI